LEKVKEIQQEQEEKFVECKVSTYSEEDASESHPMAYDHNQIGFVSHVQDCANM
jgi:hypothetical protein